MPVLAVPLFAGAFNGVPPWPAKGCLAAYTAGPAAHLLRRPGVSLAYSVLPQAEQSGAESVPGRHYCRPERDAVQNATPSRPQMALKGAISLPIAPTDPLFLY